MGLCAIAAFQDGANNMYHNFKGVQTSPLCQDKSTYCASWCCRLSSTQHERMNGYDNAQRPKDRQSVDYLADVPHYEQAHSEKNKLGWKKSGGGGGGTNICKKKVLGRLGGK